MELKIKVNIKLEYEVTGCRNCPFRIDTQLMDGVISKCTHHNKPGSREDPYNEVYRYGKEFPDWCPIDPDKKEIKMVENPKNSLLCIRCFGGSRSEYFNENCKCKGLGYYHI